MRGRCSKCGDDQELVSGSPQRVLHALTQLASPLEIEVPIQCTNCGHEVGANVQFVATNKKVARPSRMDGQPAAERRRGLVWGLHRRGAPSMDYPGVLIPGQNVLYPAHEGKLSTGHAIDRYGDPDLMAEFAVEYLKQYCAIVPKGRLPETLSEMMPALNLLVNAVELAIKADLIRSGNDSDGHSLPTLYRRVDCKHREEIERRFAEAPPNDNLRILARIVKADEARTEAAHETRAAQVKEAATEATTANREAAEAWDALATHAAKQAGECRHGAELAERTRRRWAR